MPTPERLRIAAAGLAALTAAAVAPGTATTADARTLNAIDIQHVGATRITEEWHVEDNETLPTQLGALAAR
ncbi:hypothetical protein ACFVVX_28265 [Kitasatospora sp. NPDC058170]|uniref:hypothetical protein n=1 Tax=Kitasatospora sp. NPDC058170 TaxID=3346364 RepID=UPI0036DE56D7